MDELIGWWKHYQGFTTYFCEYRLTGLKNEVYCLKGGGLIDNKIRDVSYRDDLSQDLYTTQKGFVYGRKHSRFSGRAIKFLPSIDYNQDGQKKLKWSKKVEWTSACKLLQIFCNKSNSYFVFLLSK